MRSSKTLCPSGTALQTSGLRSRPGFPPSRMRGENLPQNPIVGARPGLRALPHAVNDVSNELSTQRKPVVRPRDAASLILLRGEGDDIEVLAGRRPLHVRF